MQADLILHARWIIPVEPADLTLEHHALVLANGHIVALLPSAEARLAYPDSRHETFPHHVLLPGLVNCHTHAAMSLLRGRADDLPLMDWLQNHIWPLENTWVSDQFVTDGTDLAIAEMLSGGTTCFNDMYFFPDSTARQVLRHGIRASLGLVVFDFPTPWADSVDSYFDKALALYQQLRHEPRLNFTLAPHAPYTVSDAPLQRIAQLSQELGLPVHMHVHETRHETEQAEQNHGQRPLQRLQQLGLLNERLLAVHMTQLTAAEIDLLATTGTHIVHCPESNLKLASGFCPVAQCLKAGINVALGTDGAASNNDLDMFGEMRTAALLAKAVADDASAVPAMAALHMATLGGAKALGLAQHIGSLVEGKAADVIAVDLGQLSSQPVYHPISQIVYATQRDQVTDVWVAGQRLLQNKQWVQMDTAELGQRIACWQERLAG